MQSAYNQNYCFCKLIIVEYFKLVQYLIWKCLQIIISKIYDVGQRFNFTVLNLSNINKWKKNCLRCQSCGS